MHDNNAIYNKALKILTKYFGVDEEDSTIAPATDGQTFAFGQGIPPGGQCCYYNYYHYEWYQMCR